MATVAEVLKIIISAEDQASGALRDVAKNAGDLGTGFRSVTQPAADFTKELLAVEAAATVLATAFGAAAVAASSEFEDSLYLVAKQLDETGPSIEKAKGDIEALALQYGINANEVAKSSAGFLAAGYDYETSSKLIETSTQLMIAGELDAETATKALVSSLAGFRTPAEEAAGASEHIGDVLNKIGDISSGAFEEIVDGFVRLAPTAETAGLSVEEAAAAIAVIVDTGRAGEEAATALKSGLLSLINPSSEAEQALKDLGVATTDQNGELLSANEILGSLAGKFDGLTDSQKLQTAAVIFGKDQAGAMNSLLSDWGKSQEYVADLVDETTGAVGSMAKEVEGKLGLLSTSIDRTQEAWRQMLVAFGGEITGEGELQKMVDAFGRLGQALRDTLAAGELDPLFDPLRSAFAGLETLVSDVAENLPEALAKVDWSRFQDAVSALSESFEGLFDGIDLSTPEGLAKLVQALIDGFAGLIKVTSGIVDGLDPLFEVLGSIYEAFVSLDPEVQAAAGYFLGLSTTVNTLAGMAGGLASVLGAEGSAGGLLKSFSALGPAIAGASVALGGFELGRALSEATGFDAALEEFLLGLKGIPPVIGASDEALARSETQLEQLAKQLGVSSLSMDEFNKLANAGKVVFDEASGQWVKATGAVGDLAGALAPAASGAEAFTGEFWDLHPTLDTVAKDLATTTGSIEKTTEATKAAREETDAYRLKIAEIDAELQAAQLEAYVSIKTTQLETDAERVKALFASIDNTISSTSDLLSSLFSDLIAADDIQDKRAIEKQIELENERRREALEIQKELAAAEIERIKAQTEALQRGEGMIRIEGTELAPELEAFMWKILKSIRVRANAEFQDYLLGMGVAE